MRDEKRAALITASICALVILVGSLTGFAIIAAIVACVFALMRFSGYRKRRKLRQHMLRFRHKLAEELKAGQAHSIVCRPIRIIEREEFEDEGAFWIFDGGDGDYLAICGQEYCETPRFPSSHFEVVLGVRHGTVIGIRSHRHRVPSTLVVKGDEIAWESFPDREITVFTAPPNAELQVILERLKKAVSS